MRKTGQELFENTPVVPAFFALTLPNVFNKIVMIFYNMADTYFIAQTGDTNMVAGVALVGPVFMLMMALGDIFGLGGASLISRSLGAGQQDAARRVSSFGFWGAAGTGVVLGALLLAIQGPILAVLGADSATVGPAGDYYRWIALGAPVMMLSSVPLNLLRTEGLVNEAVAGSLTGSVVNILLDPVFILVLGLGAAGAAIATVLGGLCSMAVAVWIFARRSKLLSINPRFCHLSAKEVRSVLVIGIPASATNLMQSLCTALTNRFLVGYGADKVAAMGIAQKINLVPTLLLVSFSFGSQPLWGYNYGAGCNRRLRVLMRFMFTFLGGLALVFSVVAWLGAPQLVHIFLPDEAVVSAGSQMLRFQMVSLVFVAAVMICTVAFQSTGKALAASLLAVSRQGVVYAAALLIGHTLAGYTGILAAQPIADILTALVALGMLWRILGRELSGPDRVKEQPHTAR